MLIRRITTLPHQRKYPTKEIMGKNKDKEMTQLMKEKIGLVKKSRGYDINSKNDQGACFITHILAGKIMRKCKVNEVPAVVVSLAAQCNTGVQFNWDAYLCREFLIDCREA